MFYSLSDYAQCFLFVFVCLCNAGFFVFLFEDLLV